MRVRAPPAAGSRNSWNVSRSVISMVPSGIQLMPQGTDQPVEIVVIVDGTPVPPAAVVAETSLLAGEVLPAASWATTVSLYRVAEARPVTVYVVPVTGAAFSAVSAL